MSKPTKPSQEQEDLNQEIERYQKEVSDDVRKTLEDMGCQPILFIGSGLSIRYFQGPNWEQLLEEMAQQCPEIDKRFAYYRQSYPSLIDIGTVFAEGYKEWAWGSGQDEFPDNLFHSSRSPQVYLKYKISKYFEEITPQSSDAITDPAHVKEIELLQNVRPHALITTNYDTFLENIFKNYTPIIGQKILRTDHASIGEIFKIHGCITDPESLVLTKEDYDDFDRKKQYLSAKLLTYFAEHPLLFIGYGAGDPNIKKILSDIDEILAAEGDLIPNIYILQWKEDFPDGYQPKREEIISVGSQRNVRIKNIEASSFDWVFKAFGSTNTIQRVNPKTLRALLARTYELVRHDIPRKTIEVDYEILEQAARSQEGLAKLYGIATLDDPAAVNANYPYTLTQVGQELGYDTWHNAHKLIQQIEGDTGIDIKASDNRYHLAIRSNESIQTRKYSQAAIQLLRKVQNNEEYDVEV